MAEPGPSEVKPSPANAAPTEKLTLRPAPKGFGPHSYLWRLWGLDTAASFVRWRPGRRSSAAAVLVLVLGGGYIWDKREAKRITNEAVERVRDLGEQSIEPNYVGTRLRILTTVLPDDTDDERGRKWFKRFVKPVLISAGIDYDYLHGDKPGSLARQLVGMFRERWLIESAAVGRSRTGPVEELIPGTSGYTAARAQEKELEGGTVIVGRSALKEYLWALKRGWLDAVDLDREQRLMRASTRSEGEDEELANELSNDGVFDEADPSAAIRAPERTLPPAADLPQQPPLLLIPYSHPLGSMLWWPTKWFHWLYGRRHDARAGADLALKLVDGYSRPFSGPTSELDEGIFHDEVEQKREWTNEKRKMNKDISWMAPITNTDLDLGRDFEPYYAKSFRKWPANIAQSRKLYYEELLPKIQTARELSSGEREPSKAEERNPPATEVQLRADRLDRERRWRRNIEGWTIVRPGGPTTWDERMRGKLRVFTSPESSDGEKIVRS